MKQLEFSEKLLRRLRTWNISPMRRGWKSWDWIAWRRAGSGDLTMSAPRGRVQRGQNQKKRSTTYRAEQEKNPRNCTEHLTGSTFPFCLILLLLIAHVCTIYGPSITFQGRIHEVKAGRTPSKAWNKNNKSTAQCWLQKKIINIVKKKSKVLKSW